MKNKRFEKLKEYLKTEYDFDLFEHKNQTYNKQYFVNKITVHQGFCRVYYKLKNSTPPFLRSEYIILGVGMYYNEVEFIEQLNHLIETYIGVENDPTKFC